ncbi:MAG: ATP-binding cassette domain-containing protein [Microbacterium sp.]|uniref:ABC transporter ATP-binding protein n=1 Tax=Microbacterium sp. TaxID=51671 RepID=UPI00261E0AD0|nr:ATP-binding cassette domain-containing protein [Microbacterium sp.]MCX6501486.1 ATP-binding cassette domain-containing protein [Microbacterium sp.]
MGELTITDLRVRRGGREVVHGVDLAVRSGEVTALLGANGAGKSSTVLAIAGLVREMSGTVAVDGVTLKPGNPTRTRRSGVATVQEGHRVFADISVADNLKIAALPLPAKERADAVEAALDLFAELRGMPGRLGGQLSGGQQQMLALASALVGKPSFVVIDEMSLGLAPVIVQRLIPAVRAIVASGVGVLLIEQFTRVALELATTATVLAQGDVTLRAPAADLQRDPDQLSRAYRLSEG